MTRTIQSFEVAKICADVRRNMGAHKAAKIIAAQRNGYITPAEETELLLFAFEPGADVQLTLWEA